MPLPVRNRRNRSTPRPRRRFSHRKRSKHQWLSPQEPRKPDPDPAALKAFQADHRGASATDRDGAPVFMAKDAWEVGYVTQRHPAIRFTATKERVFADAG